jgi:hypothetical protein
MLDHPSSVHTSRAHLSRVDTDTSGTSSRAAWSAGDEPVNSDIPSSVDHVGRPDHSFLGCWFYFAITAVSESVRRRLPWRRGAARLIR